MVESNIAIIGGSGIYNLDEIRIVASHDVETPYGNPSAPILEAEIVDVERQKPASFYFLSRHGEGHIISPSEINFRANIFALKKLGVKYVISVSAVGSLKEELAPTLFVLPDQFIDWTKGLRARTFFTDGMVGHVSTAIPVELNLQEIVVKACMKANVKYSTGGTYVCIEGPQFSSKAESMVFRSFNASVIGMTNVPEAYLAKEAGMAYATIAMVTDYDCWKEDHCTVEEILKIIKINYKAVQRVIQNLVPYLCKHPVQYTPENKGAVITSDEKLNAKHLEILDVLMT